MESWGRPRAGRDASFGVNIRLPFEQSENETIGGDPKLVNFRYFFSRKVVFVKEAHAIALFPGGFGTHEEGFEALTLIQTGTSEVVPVVFMDAPGASYWSDWLDYVETHLRDRGLIDAEESRRRRRRSKVYTGTTIRVATWGEGSSCASIRPRRTSNSRS